MVISEESEANLDFIKFFPLYLEVGTSTRPMTVLSSLWRAREDKRVPQELQIALFRPEKQKKI
jgi:hypothetical protein